MGPKKCKAAPSSFSKLSTLDVDLMRFDVKLRSFSMERRYESTSVA